MSAEFVLELVLFAVGVVLPLVAIPIGAALALIYLAVIAPGAALLRYITTRRSGQRDRT